MKKVGTQSNVLPLAGKRIVVTRPRAQASSFTAKLEALGANVVEAPAISIEPPEDYGPLDRALRELTSFDWVIFTSANGVHAFFERRRQASAEIPLSGVRFAAIGPATAGVLEREEPSIHADVVPDRYVAEDVFRVLNDKESLSGKRILLPRASIAREALPDLLRDAGATTVVVTAYRTEPALESIERAVRLAESGDIDLVTFTSGSTVRSFFDVAKARGKTPRLSIACASIGPITTSVLREVGVAPVVEAKEHTADGLVEAIVDYYR
jgi:uroporphyrinogen III methyltransferase/synthase